MTVDVQHKRFCLDIKRVTGYRRRGRRRGRGLGRREGGQVIQTGTQHRHTTHRSRETSDRSRVELDIPINNT